MEIEGYPNYLIYPEGRVWSNYGKGGFLKHVVSHKGYDRVGLHRDGKKKKFSVHRLVAQTFIPNPDNKPEVDHINQDRSDNRLENLRWVTKSENGQNQGKRINNKSGHKNICYDKNNGRWNFRKMINGKTCQKYFETKIDAIVYKFCFIVINLRRKRLACGVRR